MREKLLMNRDWLFYYGEPSYPDRKYTSADQTYRGSRGENARGPARRDFDDSSWRTVQLPHDFVYEHGQTREKPCVRHDDFPADRGSAWYRKYFRLNEEDRGKHITLMFDGVSTRCEVYVNSMLLMTNRTAGIGFEVDITEVAKFGSALNEVSVHADCHDYEAWYYEGGGIYRNVYLCKTDRLAVDLWGTFVKSRHLGGSSWELSIDTEVLNDYYDDKTASVRSTVISPDGDTVCQAVASDTLFTAQEVTKINQKITVEDPVLWKDGQINRLYTLKTEIILDGTVVDEYFTDFGIREITFDPDKGMFVNGKNTTVYGFANHMTYLGVGDAMTDSMCEYHIRTIAEMGSNGYRTAHSPHNDKIYEYCDKYGLLVMDENRVFHPSKTVISEVERMIKRDRNHPSVLMWSLYNEEDTVTHETGKEIFRKLKAAAKKLDDSRPYSGATSYGIFSEGAHDDYDIIGINHQTHNFSALHKQKPDKPLYCSEMVSPLGNAPHFTMGTRMAEDAIQSEKDYVMGGFHFTAWVSRPGRGRIIDALGKFMYTAYGFRAYLKQDDPFAKISPAWDFPGKEGSKVKVYLANNGDYCEVYKNGKLADTVKTNLYSITPYETEYEPGSLKIVVYKNGKLWAEDTSVTPGKPASIRLELVNPELAADNNDAAIVNAFLVDKDGNICGSEFGYHVTFSCNEAGELMNCISLREDNYLTYHTDNVSFYDGQCQAFFRSMDTEGDLVVKAKCAELPEAKLVIRRTAEGYKDRVETVDSNYVMRWQISKLHPYSIDEEKIMKLHNLEGWEFIDTQGSPDVLYQCMPDFFRGGAALYPVGTSFNYAYHAYATVPSIGEYDASKKLALYFEGIDSRCKVLVTNGEKTVTAGMPSDSPWLGQYRPELVFSIDCFKPGDELEIWVFIYDAGRVTGIGWPVRFAYLSDDEIKGIMDKQEREWEASRQIDPEDLIPR